jgi:hypothetical protein
MHAQKSHALLLTSKTIANGHGSKTPFSSWTGSLTPSSSNIQASCTLQALISATTLQASQVLFASPLLMSFFTTTFIFNGFPWKANHHNGSFQLPSKFWTFSQLCQKKTTKCLLQSLQNILVRIQFPLSRDLRTAYLISSCHVT